jgi:hypothetical protein
VIKLLNIENGDKVIHKGAHDMNIISLRSTSITNLYSNGKQTEQS